jgi:hypothetical protein
MLDEQRCNKYHWFTAPAVVSRAIFVTFDIIPLVTSQIPLQDILMVFSLRSSAHKDIPIILDAHRRSHNCYETHPVIANPPWQLRRQKMPYKDRDWRIGLL